jgi:hypothetical protein
MNELTDSHYLVMDSRAQYDVDEAAILESCGCKQPKWSRLRKDWGNQGAVLVRWHTVVNGAYTESEVIGVIR